MIVKSLECPGRHWRLLTVGFVISSLTGNRTEVTGNDRLWIWDPARNN